jgi:hypothetical protein
MSQIFWRCAALAGAAAALSASGVAAHEIVGNRFFPATLTIDDPGVNDELAFPTVSWFKTPATPDGPGFKQRDVSFEFSKRITEDFAIAVAPTWSKLYTPGGPAMTGANGWQNLETSFKYRLYKNDEHEFVVSAGLAIEWGGSGAQSVGAERFNTYTPTIYFGKGLGDLPVDWLRPFAITGQVGYAIPAKSATVTVSTDPDSGDQIVNTELNPRVLVWGGSLQYSMSYLKSAAFDYGLPDVINHLIPIVEVSLQTPVANVGTSGAVTTGTINPGLLWTGRYMQFGVEALIPVNRQSGSSVGAIAQLHFYLDDIAPTTLGRPIFSSAMPSGRLTHGY